MADDLTAIEPAAPAPEDDNPLARYKPEDLGLDAAVKSQPIAGEATLGEYKATSGDSLAEGWKGTTGFAQQFKEYFAAKTVERAKANGVRKAAGAVDAQGNFSGGFDAPDVWNGDQPSQAEYDTALQTLGIAHARKEANDSFHSSDAAGMVAYGLGALGKGIAQPENLLQIGGIAKGVMGAYEATTAGKAFVQSMLAHSLEAGVTNAAIDTVSQGLEIGAGLEDHWSWERSGMAFGVGGVFGGAMHGAATAVGRFLAARQASAVDARAGQILDRFRDTLKPGESAFLATPPEANRFKPLPDAARLETSNPDLAPGVAETQDAIASRAPREVDAAVSEMTPEEFAASKGAPPALEPILSPDERAAAEAIGGPGSADAIEQVIGGPQAAPMEPPTPAAPEPRPMIPAQDIAADLKGALSDGSVDARRFASAPTSEQVDQILEAGQAHDASEAERLFGEDAARAQRLMRMNSDKAYDELDALVEKHGQEASDFVYGTNGARIVNREELNTLRHEIGNVEAAVFDAAKGDPAPLSRELAWIAPRLPEAAADPASHTVEQRIAVLKLARAVEDMAANNIDPAPVLRDAVAYSLKRTNGDAEDARLLMERMAGYADQFSAPPASAAEAATRHIESPVAQLPAPRPTPDMTAHAEHMVANGVTPELARAAAAPDGNFIGDVVPQLRVHTVTDAAGRKVDVVPVVMELRDLIASDQAGYDPALQPRDRTKAQSDEQIRRIVREFNPERLGYAAEADRGAPIVGDDRMVESGNGRAMAIREVYANHPQQEAAYRAHLQSLGIDAERYDQPVLVRQRVTPLTPAQRVEFTINANKGATLGQGAADVAAQDARLLNLETLDLIRNADNLEAGANREFMARFLSKLTPDERATLQDGSGALNSAGLVRARNAIVAAAYGDSPVLKNIAESLHDEVRSISNALVAAAPEYAKLRAEIRDGIVRPDMDVTPSIIEAVAKAAYLRENGIKLDAHLEQMGLFGQDLSDEALDFLRMFYNPKGRRANGADNITQGLRDYATLARQVSASELAVGVPVSPKTLQLHALEVAHAKFQEDGAQGQLLPLKSRRGGDGASDGARGQTQPGSEPGGARGGTEGAGLRRAAGGTAGNGPNAQLGPIAQPLRAQSMTTRSNGPGAVATTPAAERTFPQRRELPGEAQKPIAMPANVTPELARDFNVTNEMLKIANDLGRKLEIDGRFTLRGALGEYKPQMGVLRIRHAGDMEVFAHELGHAVDQRLSTQVTTGARFAQLKRQFAGELKPLDANTLDPTQQNAGEGLAEFLRMYVNNPAYARNQSPGFAREFEALLAHDPELAGVLQRAQQISQIDNALTPTQALAAQVAPPEARGLLAKAKATFRREGVRASLGELGDAVYAGVVAKDHWVGKFVDGLRDARFDKTGAPLPLGWKDPYQQFRMLPGAKQAAVDAILNGVRPYGGHMMQGPVVAGLHEHLSLALDGRLSRLFDDNDPLVKDFNGYLIARRATQLWDRFNGGTLRNPPIGVSEAKTRAAVAAFEAAHPNFRQAADGVFAFNRAYWDKLFDAGIIERDVYEAVNAQGADYVPFWRDMSDKLAEGVGGPARANGVQDNGVRKINGSSRAIVSPIHSIIENVAQTERMIAQNDTIKALHKLAQAGGEFAGRFLEEVPNHELKGTSVDVMAAIKDAARKSGADPGDAGAIIAAMEDLIGTDVTATVFKATDTTPKGERILFYFDGGKRIALKVGRDEFSRQFFDVFSALGTGERDIAMAVLGKANSMFSAMVTNAPEFGLKNLVMDNISRIFIGSQTGALGRTPFAAIGLGIHASLFDREFAKAYAAFGGIRGGLVSLAARELDSARGLEHALHPRTVKEMKAELLGAVNSPKNLAKSLVMSPFKAIEKFQKAIEYTETAGRLGQAKIVYRYLKKQGLSDEEALRGAFYEGRDILDYDRRGGSMGAASKMIPFLNAGIQGTDRALRNLMGAPIKALREAHARGGLDKVDAATRQAYNDALVNWGMIAAGIGLTAGYTFHMANDPKYQKETDYMRRRYFIFYPGGDDAEGNPMKITVPKPFDLPGSLMAATEFYIYGMIRQDPETYSKAAKNLLDGFVPRQFMGLEDLAAASPVIKTLYEAQTGMKLGFEGRNPTPVVPQDLKALPPEMQYDAYSSWFSKWIGQKFGVSPKKVEHVMDGLGATTSRDANAILTAALDQNPRMTMKDAMTKAFFGGLYRQDLGGGQARADVMQLMARDNGTYAQLAAGYRRAIETGDDRMAETLFNRGNDAAKSLMVLSSDAAFKTEMRALHPLVRTEKIGEVTSGILRDLAGSKVNVEDRSRKRGQLRETIPLEPSVARALSATVTNWMAEEMRNGLAVAGEPGYQTFPIIDTSGRLEAIRALSPDVADEIEGRMERRKVLDIHKLADEWPRVKDLVLSDRKAAAKELARTYKELAK